MGKEKDRDIYEQKPWLNDDKQNVEGLKKLLNKSVKGESKNGQSK